MKQNPQKIGGVKRWIFPILAILVIVLLILTANFLHSKRVETKSEKLPITEELKEQGELELTFEGTGGKV